MTNKTKLALGAGAALLALGAPTLAQKKGAGLRLSPAVLKSAQAADVALTSGDVVTADPLVTQTEAAAVSDQERYLAAALRYRAEAARQLATPAAAGNHIGLAKALDTLIASPVTPAADRGRYAYHRAQLAYFGRQYKVATDLFARAKELGYQGPDGGLTAVSARVDGGDAVGGTADLERLIAAQAGTGQAVAPDYYRYAIARLTKAGATTQAVGWMNRYAAAYPSPKTWYEILISYGLQESSASKLDDRQRLDLFRLLRAADAVPDEYFYMQYARTAQRAGVPREAQLVLREATASGKIPTANAEVKAMGTAITRSIAAEGTLTAMETKANAAATGQLAAQAGDAHLGAGTHAKAAALYRTALQKGSVDVDAINTRLGIALARSGDKPGAQAAFEAVKTGPHAEIATFWTTWLNSAPTAA